MARARMEGAHVFPYLDDLLIRAPSKVLAQEGVNKMLVLLKNCGFLINEGKSSLTPSQNLVHIGGHFKTNQNVVCIPLQRKVVCYSL